MTGLEQTSTLANCSHQALALAKIYTHLRQRNCFLMRTVAVFLCVAMTALGARAQVLETLIVTGDRGDEAPPVGHVGLSREAQLPGMRIDSAELLQGRSEEHTSELKSR